MGIRPEHLDVGDTGWEVQVETTELLGAERLIYGRVGAEQIIVRTGEEEPVHAPGATIRVQPREDRMHWFDGATRKRIAHEATGRIPAGSRTAAPASSRRKTRWPRSGSARSHGYRMFECDAKLSADGVPFLMHDSTLARTTNAAEIFGPAASAVGGDHPWAELARLDAGGWHSRAYAGEPLPTLENISRFCLANGYLLNIEIKPTPGAEKRTGEVVARHADRLWNNAPVPPLLTSFRPESLQGALADGREPAARAAAGHLVEGLAGDGAGARVRGHRLQPGAVGRGTVAQARSAGLRCLSYTVNDEWAAQRLIALGTDGIITDRVDLFPPT